MFVTKIWKLAHKKWSRATTYKIEKEIDPKQQFTNKFWNKNERNLKKKIQQDLYITWALAPL